MFREHGWPEKLPSQARYRDLHLKYNMDDYSSKGSRVIALKKMHRNLQVGMNEDPVLRGISISSLAKVYMSLIVLLKIIVLNVILIKHTLERPIQLYSK